MPETKKQLKFGLIGSSLSHSKSYKIQNAAFEKLGIEASYENFEIDVNNFDRAIIELLQKVDGLNITIPFKEKILKYLNRAEELVNRIGAANTVHINEMGIAGYNTDYYGFIDSIKNLGDMSEKKVALLGAGGAAKALLVALEDLSVKDINIYARNITKVEENLPKFLKSITEVQLLTEVTNFEDYDLLINTTPLGQGRLSNEMPVTYAVLETLPKCATVYDLIYNDTNLIKAAQELGINTINGKEMLVRQAMHSIKHWTAQDVPEDVYEEMSKAFDE